MSELCKPQLHRASSSLYFTYEVMLLSLGKINSKPPSQLYLFLLSKVQCSPCLVLRTSSASRGISTVCSLDVRLKFLKTREMTAFSSIMANLTGGIVCNISCLEFVLTSVQYSFLARLKMVRMRNCVACGCCVGGTAQD